MLGYEVVIILFLFDLLLLLLIGGICDGVIVNSSNCYGIIWKELIILVLWIFYEVIFGGRNDSYLMLVKGVNYFFFVDFFDFIIGRFFIDFFVI